MGLASCHLCMWHLRERPAPLPPEGKKTIASLVEHALLLSKEKKKRGDGKDGNAPFRADPVPQDLEHRKCWRRVSAPFSKPSPPQATFAILMWDSGAAWALHPPLPHGTAASTELPPSARAPSRARWLGRSLGVATPLYELTSQ